MTFVVLGTPGAEERDRSPASKLADISRLVVRSKASTQHGIPVLSNPYSLTVVFPRPSEAIVNTYQLACNDGDAHAVIMPNVSEQLIGRFTNDYLAWWASAAPGSLTAAG
jgi:hypothetical protein